MVSKLFTNKADLDPTTRVVLPSQLPPKTPQEETGTYLESGGNVAYLSTAYDFRVSPAVYVIQGSRYRSSQTDISLDEADPTYDRFDCVIVDSSGLVTTVTGTPAANPATPDIDPVTQFVLSTILVTAASLTPSITTISIYSENAEWTSSVNGAGVNADSTSLPFAGTKCVLVNSASSGHYVRLTNNISISLLNQKQLVFVIRSGGNFPNQKTIRITWYLGTVKIGTALSIKNGVYGFNHATTTSYQQIVIPISDFRIPAASMVDRLEFYVNGSGSAITFRLDDIYLEPNSTEVEPTVLTISGSQVYGSYTQAGMTVESGKLLGRLSAGAGPAEEIAPNSATLWAAATIAPNAVAAVDINWASGPVHSKTLSANSTFTFSNDVSGQTIVVALTNTASNYTVTWPTVSWSGGTPPTQTTGAKTDVYTFIKVGSVIYGSAVQDFS